jgi:2-keto-4-pentenoate hydratase/2-oxohepta-3-ene-1,7-dioic acid hydratase in catechol pathway
VIGAEEQIAGYTVVNDWAARGLDGPKRKDFALSLGPVVVTPDDFDGGYVAAVARLNADESAHGSVELPHSWEELREYAGRNTRLIPGDVLSLALLAGGPVRSGDVVELDVEGIGVLRNSIV